MAAFLPCYCCFDCVVSLVIPPRICVGNASVKNGSYKFHDKYHRNISFIKMTQLIPLFHVCIKESVSILQTQHIFDMENLKSATCFGF